MSVRWCFTHNNADEGWRPTFAPSTMEYIVWERETAPTTGRHHIQGYVRFKSRHRLGAVKNLLGCQELHLEPAKGTEQQNRDYCSKEEGERGESGTFIAAAGQGRRTDLDEVAENILKGQSLGEVASNHPAAWMRYHAGITSFYHQVALPPPIRREVSVKVLWGTSGVGKTHRLLTKYPEAVTISTGRDPFGSYSKEDVVVFDEFDYEKWQLQEMNRYLDCWRCKLDCRYQDKYAWWTKVYIVSNIDPSKWYLYNNEQLRNAFFRRINEIIYIESKEQIIENL